MKNYYKDIDIAIQAAIAGSNEIMKIYNDPKADFSVERKSDNSPLTIADKKSHSIIKQILQATNYPILSEEGTNYTFKERKEWDTFWMVDPLDGTKEFIKRNGEFTVNIALIKARKPIVGIIYVPVSKMLYVGVIGEGAFRINEAEGNLTFQELKEKGLQLPKNIDSRNFTVLGSRSHMNEETKNYINELRKKYQKVDIISSGSSLKICMVAEGTADEYPRFGPTMEWDTAAGHAIANAAGKKLWLTDYSNELIYNKENLLNPDFIVK